MMLSDDILKEILNEITIWEEWPRFNDIAKIALLEHPQNKDCLKFVIEDVLKKHGIKNG